MTVVASKTDQSPKARALELAKEYKQCHHRVKMKQDNLAKAVAADNARMAEITQELLQFAEENESEFDGKTCNLDNIIKLMWRAVSKVTGPADLDWLKFRRAFPHLVKMSFGKVEDFKTTRKIAKYKTKLDEYDVDVEVKDRFQIEVLD